jgi:hypothetical protein
MTRTTITSSVRASNVCGNSILIRGLEIDQQLVFGLRLLSPLRMWSTWLAARRKWVMVKARRSSRRS